MTMLFEVFTVMSQPSCLSAQPRVLCIWTGRTYILSVRLGTLASSVITVNTTSTKGMPLSVKSSLPQANPPMCRRSEMSPTECGQNGDDKTVL
jgi:hypothetical protein